MNRSPSTATTDSNATPRSGKSGSDSEEDPERKAEFDSRVNVLRSLSKRLRSAAKTDMREWDRVIRVRHFQLLLFSLIGLVGAATLSFYKWQVRCPANPKLGIDAPCEPTQIDNANFTIVTATFANTADNYPVPYFFIIIGQTVITSSTFVCVIIITQIYTLTLRERRREWSGLTEVDLTDDGGASRDMNQQFELSYAFTRSNLRITWLLEIIVHIIHPIVFLETFSDVGQTLYELSEFLIFLRVYQVARVLYINSNMYRLRHDIVRNNPSLAAIGYEISAASTAKIVFYNYPGIVVSALTIGSVSVFGFWMFIIERNNNAQFEDLWQSVWFVWVAMSSIGYGDISAVTTTGRSVVILIAFASLFITTVFSGIVTNLLTPSREQKKVESYLARRDSEDEYRRAAALLLIMSHKERRENRLRALRSGTTAAALDQDEDIDGTRAPTRNVLSDFRRIEPDTYAAIKRFRRSKMAVREALGLASDPVLDLKLHRLIVDAAKLNDMLDEQAAEMQALEDTVTDGVASLKQAVQVSKAKRVGLGGPRSGSPSMAASGRASSVGDRSGVAASGPMNLRRGTNASSFGL